MKRTIIGKMKVSKEINFVLLVDMFVEIKKKFGLCKVRQKLDLELVSCVGSNLDRHPRLRFLETLSLKCHIAA